MQVQPQRTGNQRSGEVEIGAEFVRRARLARIIARCEAAAARTGFGTVFKSAYIIPLPAMERNGDPVERRDGGVGIDPGCGEDFFGEGIGIHLLSEGEILKITLLW